MLGEYGVAMKDRGHDEAMSELFHADPLYAAELIAEIVRDGDADELVILERQLSAAFAIALERQTPLLEPGEK